jgi:hypothetical protein
MDGLLFSAGQGREFSDEEEYKHKVLHGTHEEGTEVPAEGQKKDNGDPMRADRRSMPRG